MKDDYKTPKKYSNSNDCGGGYANQVIAELKKAELKNKGAYSLAEELSQIRLLLPKDNGAQSPSDESFDEMINSGEHDFFDIPEFNWVERLSNYKSNYKSKVVKERPFSRCR